ncbi:MAG: hypothetical protein QW112_02015 [Candidatus Micrarchaeia archaeon]
MAHGMKNSIVENVNNRKIASKIVSYIFLALVLAISVMHTSFAQEYEEQTLNILVSSIERLINVSTPLNLSSLIPYKEYSSVVVVEWAIPYESLIGMKEKDVVIFITLQASNESGLIYFQENSQLVSKISTLLRCKISDGVCGPESQLRSEIPYILRINRLGTGISDTIRVRASLMPTPEFAQKIRESSELNETAMGMLQTLLKLNLSKSDREGFEAELKAVHDSLSSLDIEDAKIKLASLNATLDKLTQKSYFLASIYELEQELKRKTNLSNKEIDIASEINQILVEARAATENFDFNKAELSIVLARHKFNVLNQMIEDRMKILPLFNKSTVYNIAFVLAMLIIILTCITRLRSMEEAAILCFSIFVVVIGMLGFESIFGEGVYTIFAIVELAIFIFVISIILRRRRENWKKERK